MVRPGRRVDVGPLDRLRVGGCLGCLGAMVLHVRIDDAARLSGIVRDPQQVEILGSDGPSATNVPRIQSTSPAQ